MARRVVPGGTTKWEREAMDCQMVSCASCAEESGRSVGRVPSMRHLAFGAVCEIAGMISIHAYGFARYVGLIESWAGSRRRLAPSGADPAGPVWEIPGTAYLLTAAIADGDQARADALWKPLDMAAQVDLLQVLAVQHQCDLRTAFSVAGTDDDRYALACVLAGMNVEVASARLARHARADRPAAGSRPVGGDVQHW